MRTEDRIAALQALLARIRSRSRAPRVPGGIGSGRPTAPGLAAYADAEGRGSASGWSDIPSSANVWEQDSALATDDASASPSEADERTIQEHPGPERGTTAKAVPPSAELLEMARHDAPPMEVIELDIDPDPSMLPPPMDAAEEALESRSRLVIAPSVAPEEEDAVIGIEPPVSEPRLQSIAASEAAIPELDEFEEPAPSSSRRPISVEEKLKQLAEDDDAVHAAPPESGKLPAAPILNLEEPDVAEAPVQKDDQTALGAEVTRVTLAYADVAAFGGKAPAPRPATFGELLDATMNL